MMNNTKKFISFLESLKCGKNENLIESVKMGFNACFETPTDLFFDDAPYKVSDNTNIELKDVLKKDLDFTNPAEMKDVKTEGNKKLFSYWEVEKDPTAVEVKDYSEFFNDKQNKFDLNEEIKRKTGVVKTKMSSFKSYENDELLKTVSKSIEKHNKGKAFS